jgi:protein-S-isoprenylcysteine O-methyltransferase Ste14
LVKHDLFGKPASTLPDHALVEHDPFGKPASTLPDHALAGARSAGKNCTVTRQSIVVISVLYAFTMLRLPPPIWALIYIVIGVAVSWLLHWPKIPGLPILPVGIPLALAAWILPLWAITLFRREGTEVDPTSPTNRKLVISGP